MEPSENEHQAQDAQDDAVHPIPATDRTRRPLGAISEGIRYQVAFWWREAIPLLYDPGVERVEMESAEAGTVDDVVVHYAAPGRADNGRSIDDDYFQIKFHVGAGSLTSNSLIAASPNKLSILEKFAHAWRTLATGTARVRMSLVTNWSWHSEDPLVDHLEHCGTIRPSFHSCGSRSAAGKIRNAWRATLGMEAATFRRFCDDLRLIGSGVSQAAADEWLRLQCERAGIQVEPSSHERSALLDLGFRLLGSGRTTLDRAALNRLIDKEGLRRTVDPPYRSTLAVRSFVRHALEPGPEGAVVVDLVDLFEGRRACEDSVWSRELPRRFGAALPQVQSLEQPVRLALDAHLSIAWFLGTLLPSKAGIEFAFVQKTVNGALLWNAASGDEQETWRAETEDVANGPDLAVAISTKHEILGEVRPSLSRQGVRAGRILSLDLPSSDDVGVKSGRHAVQLADAALAAIRAAATGLTGRVHLFMACPWTVAFLVGQRFHVVGPATAYEYALGFPRTYEPTLSTDQDRR